MLVQVRSGWVRLGWVGSGQVGLGQVGSSQARSGWVMSGQDVIPFFEHNFIDLYILEIN